MKCIGRTKSFKRCKREGNSFFCHNHSYQIIVAAIAIYGFIATSAGLYQDLVKPAFIDEFNQENITTRTKLKKFSTKPTNSKFSVVAVVAGTVEVERPFIKVSVENIVIRANKNLHLDDLILKVDSVRVGIAHFKSPPRKTWDIAVWGEEININKKIKEDSTANIQPFNSLIPVDSIFLSTLENYWLVFQVNIISSNNEEFNKSKKASFSHSERNIFKSILNKS